MEHRLPKDEPEKCNGNCKACDHDQWMKCHEIETHGPRSWTFVDCERVNYNRVKVRFQRL